MLYKYDYVWKFTYDWVHTRFCSSGILYCWAVHSCDKDKPPYKKPILACHLGKLAWNWSRESCNCRNSSALSLADSSKVTFLWHAYFCTHIGVYIALRLVCQNPLNKSTYIVFFTMKGNFGYLGFQNINLPGFWQSFYFVFTVSAPHE